MLRKLIMFAITSGLAKKAWDAYRARDRKVAAPASAPMGRTARTVGRGNLNATGPTGVPSANSLEGTGQAADRPVSPVH